ncbi:MAG: 3',5'-cyclic-nucleotide phosphodiesterase [Gammaproteobacteria bacterium]
MRLRVLGCSGGIGAGLRTTSLLLDDDTLIDAGTGLGELGLDEMAAVRNIFITHSHLDHLAGLPLLLDSIFERIDPPINLYTQPETIAAIKAHLFNWTIWPDFTCLPTADQGVLKLIEMKPGEVLTLGNRRIEMIPVEHAVPAVGYRLEAEGKSIAFSGDTTTNDTLWEALNRHERLDVLIVEAAFPNRDLDVSRLAGHYTAEQLGADLAKLRHRPVVYITHAKPGAEQEIYEECRAAAPDREIRLLRHGQVFQL